MAMKELKKPRKGVEDLGEFPMGESNEEVPKRGKKEKGDMTEYPNSFEKVMTMSGTTRIMKCNSGCGDFDDIINIYIDPKGKITHINPQRMNTKGHKDVDPQKVERKDLTFWGGKPREVSAEYRRKKRSKPAGRKISHKRSK